MHRLTPSAVPTIRPGFEFNPPPLLEVLSSLVRFSRRDPNFEGRVFFCSGSDSGDGSGSEKVVEAEVKAAESGADEADSKASSAIVSTNPRLEDYVTVSFRIFICLVVCLVAERFKKILNIPNFF